MNQVRRPPNPIAVVFGSSQPGPGQPAWQTAFELGLALGAAGFTVANGGYGGTMAASARGARQAGAHTIGVTCDAWPGRPNEFIAEELRTADLHQRLRVLVDLGDCFLALPGHTGTLVELALAWELLAKKLLSARPLVCLGDFWRPLIQQMTAAGAKRGPWLVLADDVAAAVKAVMSWPVADRR